MVKKNDTPETTEQAHEQRADVGIQHENEASVLKKSPQQSVVETVDALALRHRLPTWQQSALVRMTGWTEGKSVSETEFLAALSALSARPMGGGRR